MTNSHSSSVYVLEDNSTSSIFSELNNHIEQQTVSQNKLLLGGFMFLFMTGSISYDIDINRPCLSPSLSSVYQCCIYDFDNRTNTDILYDFVSNLINNSEDLDGRIVDMVNEKFWDLI